MYTFGSGNLYATAAAANSTPRKFGALQDVSIDFQFNLKPLFGQSQFPLTVARGQGKVAGKAKAANLNGAMINDIFFGLTNAVGQTVPVYLEAGTIPTTPFQITVANGATFKEDLGVAYALTGLPLARVASAPITGQYSVNTATGVYTFAAADVALGVLIDYGYTVAGSGNKTIITNQLSGTTPTFAAVFPMKFNGKTMYLKLTSCISSKITLATKIEDFTIPEFDFEAFADASATIGEFSLTE